MLFRCLFFRLAKKKERNNTLWYNPPTQQNRTPRPSRQALPERPQSRKILNRNIIKINYGCMNDIKKDHRQTHFKFIHTSMKPQITPAQKHQNLQLPTEEYMFVCVCIYIYIYIYIYTHKSIN